MLNTRLEVGFSHHTTQTELDSSLVSEMTHQGVKYPGPKNINDHEFPIKSVATATDQKIQEALFQYTEL